MSGPGQATGLDVALDPVRRVWATIGAALLPAASLAAPHVVGFERFHADAPSAEGGAVLYSELGCANCHGGEPNWAPRSGAELGGLRHRVEREWIEGFLADPESGREGSTMPRLFHGLAESDVEAVVAYLGTLEGKGKPKPARHANAERGSALYHEKGCVACHAPTADYRGPHGSGEDWSSELAVAHPDLDEKTSLAALGRFLSDTASFRPDGRMPHFPLEKQDAVDIAAHLLDFQASDPREAEPVESWGRADRAAVERGKTLAGRLNCAACHELPGHEPAGTVALSGPPEKKSGHCLSATPAKGLPHYQLTDIQRRSLRAFLEAEPFGEEPFGEKAQGRISLAALNCYACHARDGWGGPTPETDPFFVGDEALGDSGRLPPPLTGIGHKLRRDWFEGVLAGDDGTRVRPYVATRMPVYPAHAAALAERFAAVDAKPDAKPPAPSDDLAAGRKLLGVHGGVNCITCHRWGERSSLGIQGLDISELDRRMRPAWFRSYLLDPASYRAGTLMPPLWPNGESTVKDVLEGDTERQLGAIWHFIEEGEGLPEGFPDRTTGRFELKPTDRPIIQRTFMEGVGTRAIVVGFPGDVHLAYDGGAARPALIWRGPFFDAYGTWYSRYAPFAQPLGDEVHPFPEAKAKAKAKAGAKKKPKSELESGEAAAFAGYRLDEAGNPTFLVRRDGRELEESFRVEDGRMIRTLRWQEGGAPRVEHPPGVEVDTKREGKTLTCIYSFE